MGQSAVARQTTPSLTMKFLVVLALSGLAMAEPEAEADPALLYGQYGYGGFGYPYAYGYGLRKAYAAWNPYRALHYRRHYYGKREAEAEPKPEADPQVPPLQHPVPIQGGWISVQALQDITPDHPIYSVQNLQTPQVQDYSSPYSQYYKREAEPKPEADPQMLLNGFQQAFPVNQQTIVHQANPIQTIQKTYVQQATPIQTVQTNTFHQQQPLTQTVHTKTFHQQPIHTQTVQQTFQQQPVISYSVDQAFPVAQQTFHQQPMTTVLRDAIVQEATPVQAVFNPVQNLQTPLVQAFPASQNTFTNTHIIAKREAEAEAEADPALLIHTNNGLLTPNTPLVYSNAAIPAAIPGIPKVYTTAFTQPSTLVQSVQSPLLQAVQSPLLKTVIPSVQAGVYQAGPNCVDHMGFAIPC